MTDDPLGRIPDELRGRVGVLYDDHALWGYLRVREDQISRRRLFDRRAHHECLVEEYFRTLPPAPDAVDAADVPGWSDTYVMPPEIPDEIERLTRNELLLTGRILRIEWLNGQDAEAVRAQYFAD
jgi:hypothetical protein